MPRLERHDLSGVELMIDFVELAAGDIRVEVERGHSEQLVPRIPQAFASLAVHVQNRETVIQQEECVRGVIDERLEPFVAAPRHLRLFRLAALRHVAEHQDDSGNLAALVDDGRAAVVDRQLPAVSCD